MNELYSIVYDICRDTPQDTLDKISEILEKENDINAKQLLVSMSAGLPTGKYFEKFKIVFSICQMSNLTDPKILSNTIRSLSFALNRQRNDLITEIVWTGPQVKGHPLRPTDLVLDELISSAKKELLIVSFVVYRESGVAQRLIEAMDRGVSVTFVLESAEDSDGRMSFDGIDSFGKEILDRAKIFHWPKEKRDLFSPGVNASLHVKCAVADNRDVLISSANLTRNALKHNMEMGLRVVNNSLAERVTKHFKELIHGGILVSKEEVS